MEDFSRLKPVGRRSRAAQMAPENPLGKMLQASSRQKGPQGPFHDPASQSAPKRRRRYHIERIIRRRIARRYIVLCRIMRWRIIFRCIMRWRIMRRSDVRACVSAPSGAAICAGLAGAATDGLAP